MSVECQKENSCPRIACVKYQTSKNLSTWEDKLPPPLTPACRVPEGLAYHEQNIFSPKKKEKHFIIDHISEYKTFEIPIAEWILW